MVGQLPEISLPFKVLFHVLWLLCATSPAFGYTNKIMYDNGRILEWSSKGRGEMATFRYLGKTFALADTTPWGGNFSVWGDTQSPKGTGVSMSSSGVAVIMNGVHHRCKKGIHDY
jgi:hypothetical protein